ncbi:hypothetical protein [Isoptericola sp. NPDC019571]|uniref:hypothetical protein n=1 Tax=Isoptericola sp. NPDC019571 TaxID=3364008 RepID=UPI0037A2042E
MPAAAGLRAKLAVVAATTVLLALGGTVDSLVAVAALSLGIGALWRSTAAGIATAGSPVLAGCAAVVAVRRRDA